MVFDFASQSGDCGSSDQRSTPIFNSSPSDNTVRINTQSDTTSNTAVTNLPTVEFAGPVGQQAVFRTIARDAAPPVPQGTFPFATYGDSPTVPQGQFPPAINPFKQPGLLLLPEPSASLPGQNFADLPQVPKPQPGPFPPGPGPQPQPFNPDQPFRPIQPKPGPDSSPDMRDKPLSPGPFAPAPMSASGFSADQVRSILADRDRAIALNRGQKPTDKPGIGPLVPAPDGRNPFKPDQTPETVRPNRTEFLQDGEFNDAVKTAKDSGRPLIISFTKNGCGYCTQIEDESWPSQKGTVENEAIRTKVNASRNREMAQKFGVRSYPTTIVVNPNTMQEVDRKVGMVEAGDLGSFLQSAFQKMKGGG